MWTGLLVLGLVGCGARAPGCPARLAADGRASCAVPGWTGRDYTVWMPDDYRPKTPIPVVLHFHGGGGQPSAAERTSCANGEVDDPSCMHGELADDRDFAVVYPAGTKARIGPFRTWNTGGGEDDFRCTSGRACEEDVDDTAYVRALLADLEGRMAVDPQRIYATGLSNGGSMSHRLACTMSDRIAAIAPVGGAMQWTTTETCAPERPVPVLQIHGTGDPCWKYDGGPSDCPVGQDGLKHVSVDRTLKEWRAIHGCRGPAEVETLANPTKDGTRTKHHTWPGCTVEHLEIVGGGHTWPSGQAYLSEDTVGTVSRDWGSERIWAFFEAHPKTD